MNWNNRSSEQETLDDLDFSGPELRETLDELSWVHRYLGGRSVTIGLLNNALKNCPFNSSTPLCLLDAGCGRGDALRSMAKWTQKSQYDLQLHGIDGNPAVIDYAREQSLSFPDIEYQPLNLFDGEMDWKQYDIVHFGLILHHFSDRQIHTLLERCAEGGVSAVLINDLHRHPLAYHLFRGATKLLGFSDLSRKDGLRSIRKAFKKSELREIMKNSPYKLLSIRWRWAFRYGVLAVLCS